jgi:hypothetical protein
MLPKHVRAHLGHGGRKDNEPLPKVLPYYIKFQPIIGIMP